MYSDAIKRDDARKRALLAAALVAADVDASQDAAARLWDHFYFGEPLPPDYWPELARVQATVRDVLGQQEGDTMQQNGLKGARQNTVTARDEIRRAIAGKDADLGAVLVMLDRAVKSMCPHGPGAWMTLAPPPAPGETWVTCSRCNVGWQEHDA